ncbi:MAG: nucleoid occlusion protein [Clostridiales bacterium]|nr:nucleoid occlusion protein [Clostridiales bacterium]
MKVAKVQKDQQKESNSGMVYLPVNIIRPNPYQPRKQFTKPALDELCDSIKEYGVIQPINVRKIPGGQYELIAGERRLRASIQAGIEKIPAIILNVNENDSAVMALIENLQREDLTYLEEADGYNNLITDHGFTQEELARKIGKSQSTIANKIRLLKLSALVKKILNDNGLTERHARALLKLHDEQLQLKVLKYVCIKGLNVKKTEEIVEKAVAKYSGSSGNPDANIKQTGAGINGKETGRRITHAIKDIRIFVNTIKQGIEMMKKSGVNARAAQFDRGDFVEFVIRIPK